MNKGLNFTPTPNRNDIKLQCDLAEISRKIRVVEKSYSFGLGQQRQNSTPADKSKNCFKNQKFDIPSKGRNSVIDRCCNLIDDYANNLSNLNSVSNYNNLSVIP